MEPSPFKRRLARLRDLMSPSRFPARASWVIRRFLFGPGADLPRGAQALAGETFEVLGLVLKSLGRLDEAADVLSRVTRANPHAINAFRYLAEVRFRQRDTEGALAAALKGLRVPDDGRRFPLGEPATLAFPGGPFHPAGPEVAPGRPITIATTLMPRRLEIQKAAVASWRAYGFDIVSVNTAAEIETLAPLFPDIRFIQPARTGEHMCRRPLIMLDGLMEALEAADCEICGIVNSDIVIRHDPAFRRAIEREHRGSLVFGNRIDLEDPRGGTGAPFSGGYDFFFFEKAAIPLFRGTELVLGMPWWDFWAPMAARLGGLAVKKLQAPMVLHLVHPVGYHEEFFHSFSAEFLTSVNRLIERFPDASLNRVDVFLRRFYGALATASASGSLETLAPRVGTICAFTNFLIDHMAIDITVTEAAGP